MSEKQLEPTRDALLMIREWSDAVAAIDTAERRLMDMKNELRATERKLGEFMCPKNATTNEVFCIWVSDGLLQTKKLTAEGYEVSWRQRPSRGLR